MRLRGDRVMAVTPGGPAARAGIAVGDHLVAPPPAVPGARPRRHLEAARVTLIAAPPGASERARAIVALVLAAAFALVGALALAARGDRLVVAFALFAFSAALALAPHPVAPAWLAGPAGRARRSRRCGCWPACSCPPRSSTSSPASPRADPERLGRGLAVAGYGGAMVLFAIGLGLDLSSPARQAPAPARAFLAGGAFEALAALFLCGALLAAVVTFVASYRRAAAQHRPRLTALVWSVTLGLVPLAAADAAEERRAGAHLAGRGLRRAVAPARARRLRLRDRRPPRLRRRRAARPRRTAPRAHDRGGDAPARRVRPPRSRRSRRCSTTPPGDARARAGTRALRGVRRLSAGAAHLAALHGEAPRRRGRLRRARCPTRRSRALSPRPRARSPPEELALGGAGASLLVPLFAEDRCRAVLALGPRLSGPWFDAGEREQVAAFAREASARVENAVLHDRLVERAGLERDVQLARRIQERLLPHAAPVLPTVDLAGVTVPAGEIGGDYYDFLRLGSRTLGVAVADVCGKGLPAALLLAGVQAGLRSRVDDDLAPGAVLARVNEELVQLRQPEKFVCLAYARLDALRRTLTWANAGLNPPIVVHPDGRFEEVEHGGLILGVAAGEAYEEIEWTFERGSLIAFYTDGLTDALQGDTPFDPERLGRVLVPGSRPPGRPDRRPGRWLRRPSGTTTAPPTTARS